MTGPRLAVLLSQKPRFEYLLIDRASSLVDLETPERVLGRADRHAVEEALRVREAAGGHVTVYAVDTEGRDEGVREALAMGADEAIVVSSKAIAGADLHAKANLLARAVTVSGDAALVLSATHASEASWGTVGGELAAILDRPLLPSARAVRLEKGRIRAEVILGGVRGRVSAPLPAVATVGEEANEPRYPTSWGVGAAYRDKRVRWWHLKDMEIDGRSLARMASRTEVRRQGPAGALERPREAIREDVATAGRLAAKRLSRHGFLGGA